MKIGRKPWNARRTPVENARRVLPVFAAGFFEAGRKAAGETSQDSLHDFRLTVKRFRYVLEAFRPLYGAGLEDRLEALRELQQLLGSLNDSATTRRLLANGDDAETPEVRQVLALAENVAAEKVRKFKRYWKSSFDSAGQEQKWTSYLQRQARARVGRK